MRKFFFIAVFLAACRTDEIVTTTTKSDTPQVPLAVSSVQSNVVSATIRIGDSVVVVAEAVPTRQDASFDKSVTWTIFSPASVRLSRYTANLAVFVGTNTGVSLVDACSTRDSNKCAHITFNVVCGMSCVPATSSVVSLYFTGDSTVSVKVGQIKQMPKPTCVMSPTSASCPITWYSSDMLVLSVNASTGVVTGLRPGQAQIFVKANADMGKTAYYPKPVQVVP